MRMQRRHRWMWVVAVFVSWAASWSALPAQEQPSTKPTRPPQQGQWVRGHWTPYQPPDPAGFPEGTKVHTIAAGDTLWDLATTYLGSPWLWPQIWDQNRYVLDSHWIYPGDPLIIPGPPTVVGEATPPPAPAEAPAAEVTPILPPGAPPAPPAPEEAAAPEMLGPELAPVASESDLYCSTYLAPEDLAATLRVAEREEEAKLMLASGDIVYINGGLSESVLPGMEFTIVRPGRVVEHPATGDPLGTLVSQLGRLKIIASQEHTATAIIEKSCDEIVKGDWLQPFQEVPVPLSAGVPFERYGVDLSGKTSGFIVYGAHDLASLGTGDLVEIDLGTGEGVSPGDFLTIFRDYRRTHGFYSTQSYIDAAKKEELRAGPGDYPAVVLGQMVVLRVGEHNATAKIVRSVREITVGDKVAKG